jgi:ribosomal protein S18 acetylase RimI-like enzyme
MELGRSPAPAGWTPGAQLFELHHGQWQQDYRDELSTLHDPATGRWIAVAKVDGAIAALVAWNIAERRDHGRIYLLAVSQPYRRGQVGRQLCLHALEVMKAIRVKVVELGTGEGTLHTAARALYESLGFTKVPIAGYIKRIWTMPWRVGAGHRPAPHPESLLCGRLLSVTAMLAVCASPPGLRQVKRDGRLPFSIWLWH